MGGSVAEGGIPPRGNVPVSLDYGPESASAPAVKYT